MISIPVNLILRNTNLGKNMESIVNKASIIDEEQNADNQNDDDFKDF